MSQSQKQDQPEPQTDLTADEIYDSLTGDEEELVIQHFRTTIHDLLVTNPSMYARALIFVLSVRAGTPDIDAKAASQKMRMGDVFTYFPNPSEESGKDETSPGPQPESAPIGAPEPDVVELSI